MPISRRQRTTKVPEETGPESPFCEAKLEAGKRRSTGTAVAGLGPAMATKLRQEGIVDYAQLAALSQGEIARLEKDVIKSSGRFKRDARVGQARRLARA